MPEITVKLSDQILQTCQFDGEVLSVGRSRENDIVLENLSVSREHVLIRHHEGRYILTDLNSANGTLVNGVRVTKTEIVDEDVITVGKHKLHFRIQDLAAGKDADANADAARTVMVEPRADVWLVVESGKLKGREFRITRFETSLGKAPTNDVVLTDDWLLAKKQAIILRKGNNEFEVQDLGGLRKVKVNGTAINEKADITDGDVIELGGTRLVFRSSVAKTPTGRIPKEISAEREVFGEPVRGAGSLNGSRRQKAETRKAMPAVKLPLPDGDESLDLEDGYEGVKISLQDESARQPVEAAGAASADSVPEVAELPELPAAAQQAADTNNEETPPTPVAVVATAAQNDNGSGASAVPAVEGPANVSEPKPQTAAVAVQNGQHQPFEDKRSTGRRRRKHHQRAVQKQAAVSANSSNGSLPAPAKRPKPAPAAPQMQHSELSAEKEIAMWEDALNNPSPVIKRQAAKMLKKLTGKDYEV